jgi:hypothetical protein
MKRTYLVACSAKKLPYAAPARDLYQGQAFKMARQIVELDDADWFILSAAHGVVSPSAQLHPYDVTLRGMGFRDYGHWQSIVGEQLAQLIASNRFIDRTVTVLAGQLYAEPVLNAFASARGAADGLELPLKGLGIGQQLGALKAWRDDIQASRELMLAWVLSRSQTIEGATA